jgi:phospholipid/cholesterol/gamma-HCH transport system substrate-binding protein
MTADMTADMVTTGKNRRLTAFRIGVLLIVVAVLAGVALFNKNRILTTLRPGDTFDINFAAGSSGLVPYVSQVKVSFVPVGVITGIRQHGDDGAIVSVKVDNGITDKLGGAPSAVLRPTTLLGGNYFVDLQPGGAPGRFTGTIPIERTALPVELDKVAAALQPRALDGLRHSITNLDQTLRDGGRPAIADLLADAPAALDPAAGVLDAARGANADVDLARLVSGLETASRELTGKEGELDAIVDDLAETTELLARRRDAVAGVVEALPSTLDEASVGLSRLRATLIRLRDTAGPARPVVAALDDVLRDADPVLAKARPVVHQLRSVMTDARPLVAGLVGVTRQAGTALEDIRGPVLDRVNGPVTDFLLAPYHGSGPYSSAGSDKPLYQELAYMFATLTRASSMSDQNGPAVSFQPGVGVGSVGGLPISLEQLFVQLSDTTGIPLQNGGRP